MSAILIKPDGSKQDIAPSQGNKFSLEELQELVGGYIEIVVLSVESRRIMVIDEEGKAKGKEVNISATMLCRISSSISLTDFVVGDVVVADSEQIQ
jgi:hypothetical protein